MMDNQQVRLARPVICLLVLTLLAFMAALSPRLAAQNPAGLPIDHFFPWELWSAKTPTGSFDMTRCKTLQAGDANGDGRTDLICPYDYGGGQMRTFVQYSQGDSYSGWTAMHSQFLDFDLTKCRTLQSGQVDADTWTDLICPYDNDNGTNATLVQIAGAGSYSPWILHQGGAFDLETCRPLVAGRNSLFLYTGLICVRDLGNDTTRTLVQYSNGATLSQWLNGSPLASSFNVNSCRSVRVGDVNGDVRDDLLCPYDYDNASTRTFVQLATINYEYTNWIAMGPLQPAGSFDMNFCQALLVGDADGNGYDDLLCPYDYGGDQTRTFVQYSLGNNLTGWTAMQDQLQSLFNVNSCRPLVTGDLNYDGRTDLICPYDYGGGSTTTFVQMSLGSEFTPWQVASEVIPAGNFDLNRCRTLVSGDADGDGHTDLICPYDYDGGSTATFVQAAQIYRVALPAIIH